MLIKSSSTQHVCLFSALLFCMATAGLRAVDEPDPAKYRENVMQNSHLKEDWGEAFCWHASYGAGEFIAGYKAFKNPKWLEEAEKYYDFFCTKLKKDPDGYEGWIGNTIFNTPEIQEDALVGDAVLCRHLVEFAEVVMADEALKKQFGEKAQQYLDLSTRIMWEKWNKRGTYYQDAAGFGSYHSHGRSIDTKTGVWLERPATMLTQPFNKSADAAIVLLRLWRITGKPEYKERVERIFSRVKMLFRLFPDEDRVVWQYWTPHGPWDIQGKAPKHWVGVHPERPGYQAGEVHMFEEVYNSGLVFEKADLERVIRTNHWMAQVGKGWRGADGGKAGELWSGLVQFDEDTRAKYLEGLKGKTDDRSKIALAYYENVTAKHLGWDRTLVKDPGSVKPISVPLQAGKVLSLALPIPDVVETVNNMRIKLVTQTCAEGTLKIELLDAAGKDVLGTLATIQVPKSSEYNAPRWDGTNPKTGKKDEGEYRIRWTLNGESRLETVWVKPGVKRDLQGPTAMKAGETISVDFEHAPDDRWHVEGAAPSDEQAHGGKKSLKVIEGQSAVLLFGEDDDLPVKISFWIYDSGIKLGKNSVTGSGWGVVNADGDRFAVRACWRKYLGGDTEYAWFNTGENQWYSPHPAKVGRKQGWTECIFDFSDPAAPKITVGGQALGNVEKKFIPKGATGIFMLGGDTKAGPFYIDDLTIEYPKK